MVKETNENSFLVDNRVTWELEDPALYTLETILESEYGISTYKTRFGFRSVFFTKEGFYLNSKKIKLVGLNRMAISDHDCIDAYYDQEFIQTAKDFNIEIIPTRQTTKT